MKDRHAIGMKVLFTVLMALLMGGTAGCDFLFGTDSDDCNDCAPNAFCTEESPDLICQCDAGFFGDPYDVGCVPNTNTEPCDGVDCPTNSVCGEGSEGFGCYCVEGFDVNVEGTACVPPSSETCETECPPDSFCVIEDEQEWCYCDPGFAVNPDETGCASCALTCPDNASCGFDALDAPTCLCDVGFEPDPTLTFCQPEGTLEGCEGVDCAPNEHCEAAGGEPDCVCDDGYNEDAVPGVCLMDVATCTDFPCPEDAYCTFDSGAEPVCACSFGTMWDATMTNCVPEPSPCQGVTCGANEQCDDGAGIAQCNCVDGYYFDPSAGECVSDDSCGGRTCPSRSYCTVFDTCECDSGYVWNSSRTRCDRDPCASVQCIPQNSHCEANFQGQPSCVCDSGYMFDSLGVNCVTDSSSPCDGMFCTTNATCQVRGGSGVCECDSGYQWNGSMTQCEIPAPACSRSAPCLPGTSTPIRPGVCTSFLIGPNAFPSYDRDFLCDQNGNNLHVMAWEYPAQIDIDVLANMAGVGIISIYPARREVDWVEMYTFLDDTFVGEPHGTPFQPPFRECGLAAPTLHGHVNLVVDPGVYQWRMEAFENILCNKYSPRNPILCGDDFDPNASVLAADSDSVSVFQGSCVTVVSF